MGYDRFDGATWDAYTTTHVADKPRAAVFTSRAMIPDFDPAKFQFRESRDSDKNPNSTGVLIGSDVTGSMGQLAHLLLKDQVIKAATELYDDKPISDPHIAIAAIGDAEGDEAPLQVTQFEASITLADQVKRLWLEGGGGGNMGESYMLLHAFAAFKTQMDCFQKRGKRGYLFTIGDEPTLDGVTKEQMKAVLNLDVDADLSAADCIAMASRTFDVYHLVLQGGYAANSSGMKRVMESWKPILPQRTLVLSDPSKLAEVIAATIRVAEGANKGAVAAKWGGDTSLVVAQAIKDLAGPTGGGIKRLA